MKKYCSITDVCMANNRDIYNIRYDMEDCDYATKAAAMEASEDVVVAGYGVHSGRKVWQLPAKIRAEISKLLKKQEIVTTGEETG